MTKTLKFNELNDNELISVNGGKCSSEEFDDLIRKASSLSKGADHYDIDRYSAHKIGGYRVGGAYIK
ncbi:MAG: bacteriocin [Spirochaetales bacterium]|nr:bacteriocin [Spirochaetales bacterium]